jgi:hypothetical protein
VNPRRGGNVIRAHACHCARCFVAFKARRRAHAALGSHTGYCLSTASASILVSRLPVNLGGIRRSFDLTCGMPGVDKRGAPAAPASGGGAASSLRSEATGSAVQTRVAPRSSGKGVPASLVPAPLSQQSRFAAIDRPSGQEEGHSSTRRRGSMLFPQNVRRGS